MKQVFLAFFTCANTQQPKEELRRRYSTSQKLPYNAKTLQNTKLESNGLMANAMAGESRI